MMRIAYLSADCGIPVFGDKGGAVHVREMINAFEAIGAETRLVATRLGDGPDDGIRPRTIPVPVPERSARLSGRAEKERTYLAAAEQAEAQLVRLFRDWPFDLIYERYSLWSAAGVRAARRLGVPAIVEVNAPLVREQAIHRSLALEQTALKIEREVFRDAGSLVVVSAEVGDYAVSRGASPAKVEVIGNGVDTSRFHPAAAPDRLGLSQDAFTIGFTGSLKPWHGIDILAEAFRRVRAEAPEAHLVLIGDGPLRGWMEGWLAGAQLGGAATLTGWVEHSRLPALLTGLDVVTAPYPPHDGFYFSPLKLYEYLAAGRPVVASRIGQIAETLTDGKDALLTGPGDADALAAAILRLRGDPGLAARLAAAAAMLGARFSWTRNAERVVELFQRRRQVA